MHLLSPPARTQRAVQMLCERTAAPLVKRLVGLLLRFIAPLRLGCRIGTTSLAGGVSTQLSARSEKFLGSSQSLIRPSRIKIGLVEGHPNPLLRNSCMTAQV